SAPARRARPTPPTRSPGSRTWAHAPPCTPPSPASIRRRTRPATSPSSARASPTTMFSDIEFLLSYCVVFVRAHYSSKLLTASKQITGRNIFYQVFRGIGYGFAFAILLFVILSFRYQIEVQKYSFLIILLQLVSQLII